MKKHAFWFQMCIAIGVIIGGILLIILRITKDISIDGAGAVGVLFMIFGIWHFVTIRKT